MSSMVYMIRCKWVSHEEIKSPEVPACVLVAGNIFSLYCTKEVQNAIAFTISLVC